jgi:hypothetical protein
VDGGEGEVVDNAGTLQKVDTVHKRCVTWIKGNSPNTMAASVRCIGEFPVVILAMRGDQRFFIG